MEAMKSDFENDIKALLTNEQQEKYEDYLRKNQPNPQG